MKHNLVSAVWQTLKVPDTEKPKRRTLWWLMKLIIKILVITWKLLKLFTVDGEGS